MSLPSICISEPVGATSTFMRPFVGLVEPDTADPEGMPNINTPGAPQPIDYKLGGADPQYLKDKAEFIRKWRNNQQARPKPQVSPVNRPNTQTALRENEIKRMQMLAGMFKKNNK